MTEKILSEGLKAVKIGSRWGYADAAGNLVIFPAWDVAGAFRDGIAPVMRDGKWGYIDRDGKIALKLQYESASELVEGVGIVTRRGFSRLIGSDGHPLSPRLNAESIVYGWDFGAIYIKRENCSYVVDRHGNRLGKSYGGQISSPRLPTKESGKYGYTDLMGEWRVNPIFDEATEYVEGLVAFVAIEGKWGMLDRDGRLAIPTEYDSISGSEDFVVVKRGEKYGAFDIFGRQVAETMFDDVSVIDECTAKVTLGGRHFFLNINGAMTPAPLEYLIDTSGKRIDVAAEISLPDYPNCVYQPGHFCIIQGEDGNGGLKLAITDLRGKDYPPDRMVIENISDKLFYFTKDGICHLRYNGRHIFIDKHGYQLYPAKDKALNQPEIEDAGEFADGLCAVTIGGKWGFVDTDFNQVIAPRFDYVAPYFTDGLCLARVNNRHGYINPSGAWQIPPIYSQATQFSHGLALVTE